MSSSDSKPVRQIAHPVGQRYSPDMGELAKDAGLVLVVDDEATVRKFAEHSLVSEGFRVALAGDGDEAWAHFHGAYRDITAVVLDLRTPGRPTEELVHAIRRLAPTVTVVLSSGFVDDEVRDRLQHAGVSVFLEKPWTRDELLGAVKTGAGG